ncbi:MAG: carboxypeptidase-like regulatory domain-containing protein [Terriglobia bacterium]
MRLGKSGCFAFLLVVGRFCVDLQGAELVGIVRETSSGEAIVGASVRAIPVSRRFREVQSKTGPDGHYQLDLLKGKYRLFVSFPGTDYLAHFVTGVGQIESDILDVSTFDSFRVIDITMSPGGSIAGKVLRSLDQFPLPGIRVTVASPQFRTSSTSRPDGSYVFRALPPGTYSVQAVPLNENYVPAYYENSRDPGNASMISIQPKQAVTGIDFRLRAGGIVSGRVYANKNRGPIAGMKVIAENLSIEERPAFALTDAQGFYTLRGLTPGDYILETQTPSDLGGNRMPMRKYLMQYQSGQYDRELADKFPIEPGSHYTGVDFALVEGGNLSGTVRSRYHNAPLGGVTVVPWEVSQKPQSGPPAKTGPTGNYQVTDLLPGEYVVSLSLPITVRRLATNYYRDKLSENLADRIVVEEGEQVQRIDFNLPLGSTLQGRMVFDGSDYPVKSVHKALRFERLGTDLEGFGRREFNLEADGKFVIEGAPSGRYNVTPLTDDPNIVPESDSRERTFELVEGSVVENLDFNMRIAGSIRGAVAFQGEIPEFDRYVIMIVNLKDNSRTYFELSSQQFLLNGLDQGKYLLLLLSKSERMGDTNELAMPVLYDTAAVEVQRGRTSADVSLHLNREMSFPAKMYP